MELHWEGELWEVTSLAPPCSLKPKDQTLQNLQRLLQRTGFITEEEKSLCVMQHWSRTRQREGPAFQLWVCHIPLYSSIPWLTMETVGGQCTKRLKHPQTCTKAAAKWTYRELLKSYGPVLTWRVLISMDSKKFLDSLTTTLFQCGIFSQCMLPSPFSSVILKWFSSEVPHFPRSNPPYSNYFPLWHPKL